MIITHSFVPAPGYKHVRWSVNVPIQRERRHTIRGRVLDSYIIRIRALSGSIMVCHSERERGSVMEERSLTVLCCVMDCQSYTYTAGLLS